MVGRVMAILLGMVAAANAAPITIDFEDLRTDSALAFSVGSTYNYEGFTLTGAPASGSSSVGELDYFGTLSNEFFGSTALFNCCALDSVILTRTDGGAFSLRSIDLIEVRGFNSDGSQADFGPGSVTFVGTKLNGTTISHVASFLQFPIATEVEFAGFSDLLSVSWQQGPGGVPGPTYQFDNIRVQAVPEPSTLTIVGVGLLALLRKRLADPLA